YKIPKELKNQSSNLTNSWYPVEYKTLEQTEASTTLRIYLSHIMTGIFKYVMYFLYKIVIWP
ncbi:hypothetical protein ACQP3F_32755, partial [Escherichia coli]